MAKHGSLLVTWARFWAACCLMDVWQQPYNWPNQPHRMLCSLAAILALLKPSLATLIVPILIRNASRCMRMPFAWDSDYWALFLDFAFLIGISQTVKKQNTIDSGDSAVRFAAPIVQSLLSIFYFAAGFWKINTSFLSPRTSCGSILLVSWLVQLWPTILGQIPQSIARLTVLLGPWMTVAGECSAGVMLAIPGKTPKLVGLCLLLLLHVGISFTCYPNGIANFSYTAATRYYFLVPEGSSKALAEVFSIPGSARSYAVRATIAVVLAAAWHFGRIAGPQHMGAVFYSVMTLLYIRGMQLEWTQWPSSESPKLGAAGWLYIAVVSFCVFGTQVLGLVDLSAPASPFASIRVHGGSNHWIMPTGLLQLWAAGRAESASSFGGGVVRVEYTDSVWLNSLYPAEHTSAIPASVVETLRRGGHLGRQFNPTPRRVLGPEIRSFMPRWEPGAGPFVQYTVPAMELRRLVSEARASGEPFSIVYVRLPGVLGDEVWRASAQGRRVQFNVTKDGQERCTSDGHACGKDELVFLPELDWLSWKTRVFFPLPIIPDADHELPCID